MPVVFGDSPSDIRSHTAEQAAWLARRFHAEIILLHVVTPLSYPAAFSKAVMKSPSGICTHEYSNRPKQNWIERFGQNWMAFRSHACYSGAILPMKSPGRRVTGIST